MSSSSTRELTKWVRSALKTDPENKIRVRYRHIERDRIWREINRSDVLAVLISGEARSVRESDKTIFWRGNDDADREIELQIGIENSDGEDVLIVEEAVRCRVGTAYDPRVDDEHLKKEWLKSHPEYEELEDGSVTKKITVVKIR